MRIEYRVLVSEIDDGYRVTSVDFPHLTGFGPSVEQAELLVKAGIASILEGYLSRGESIPNPNDFDSADLPQECRVIVAIVNVGPDDGGSVRR